MKRSLAPSQTGKQNSTSLSSILGKRTNVTSSFQPPQTKKSKLVEFQTEKMEVENIKNISSSIEMDENEKAKIQSTEKISPLTNKPKINKGPLKQLVKIITPISSSSKEAPKNSTETSPSKNGDSALIVYKIFHTKRSNKKHKNWDEGILTIKGTLCTLKDMHGTDLAKSSSNSLKSLKELESGKTITVGAYEIEV